MRNGLNPRTGKNRGEFEEPEKRGGVRRRGRFGQYGDNFNTPHQNRGPEKKGFSGERQGQRVPSHRCRVVEKEREGGHPGLIEGRRGKRSHLGGGEDDDPLAIFWNDLH